jgi:hypothetical protein
MTRRKRLPWSTPRITHDPVAWGASSTFAGETSFLSKPRTRNVDGELLAEKRDRYGRLVESAREGAGRKLSFSPEAQAELMNRLEPHVIARRHELGRLPPRDDVKILRIACSLIEGRGLGESQAKNTIMRQLIDPVLQKLKAR